jgi:post-segregation antitoxin (ccd killing protein)
MAQVQFHTYGGDIITIARERLEAQLTAMKIDEIFDGAINKKIPIYEAHPISVLTSEWQENDAELMARVPCIGMVEMDDDESPKNLMATSVTKITKADIDAELAKSPKDRWRQGTIASNATLNAVSAYLDTLTDKQLDALTDRELRITTLKISVWAHHPVAMRILKNITRSSIQGLKNTLNKSYVLMSFEGVGNLYNFDFGRILYGWDWNLKLVGSYENIPVDTDVSLIAEIDTGAYINDTVSKIDSTPRFRESGGGDVYEEI